MFRKSIFLVLPLLLFCIFGGSAFAASQLYLSVSASMTDVFKTLISVYSQNHPDTRILANYGSSGSLAKHIVHGAPPDLYVSANPKWMAYLIDEQAVMEDNTSILAYNKLVFIGSSNLNIVGLSDLSSLTKIGIGNPMSVPAGQYAKQAMDGVGIYDVLKENNKLVMAKDVRQALLYADRGEVDGAFVYQTDASMAREANVLFVVPDELYPRVSYMIGITMNGQGKENALSFFNFIFSSEGMEILQKYGFDPHEKKEVK